MNPVQKLKQTSVLQALSPLETLRLLAGSVEKLAKGEVFEPARITVYLSGATFSGFVSSINEQGDASYILFVEHDDAAKQGMNIIYIPVWTITAIKVHDADQYLHLLSGGKVEAQHQTIGIVTLRRKIAEEVLHLRTIVQADIKLEVSWETLTQDDVSLLSLFELIDNFMQVLQTTITDEFKRIAFKNFIGVIRFQNSQQAEMYQDINILIIRANLKERSSGRFTREEFKDGLGAILDDVHK